MFTPMSKTRKETTSKLKMSLEKKKAGRQTDDILGGIIGQSRLIPKKIRWKSETRPLLSSSFKHTILLNCVADLKYFTLVT